MSVLGSFLFFLGAAFASAVAVICLWIDLHIFDNNIGELSLTEIIQELILLVIVFIHFMLAKKYETLRYCNILVGGFFIAMFIRELDVVFDLIFHGRWVWFAIFSTLCTLIYPAIHFRKTLTQLEQYTRISYYGMMISGLLMILVFSRLFGMQALWHSILAEGYARKVKNAVEEGCELFGYMLCLMASIGYYNYYRELVRKSVSTTSVS